MQAISAPYNFVPLADWVHIPTWSPKVSHDWPFRDGVSGEIHYTLHAASPLLVGGHQQPATSDQAGIVTPFKLPNGRYAIPGSSLKGMLRAVVEIAGFGRMRMVDNQRPALRDISGKYVSPAYANKVRNRMTGFLRRRPDGGQEIVPCKMVRLDHRDLETMFCIQAPIFRKGSAVHQKYHTWNTHCGCIGSSPENISFKIIDKEAKNLGTGPVSGVPVFTGQISDSTIPKGKHRDFVFYDPDLSATFPVPQAAWRDFLRIHGDEDGKPDMSWPGYWRSKFRHGDNVPVFYLRDGDLLRIGLAYMLKLAGDYSVYNLIEHSSRKHGMAPGAESGYDLADLLFGAIGEHQTDALRGRVSCEIAVADPAKQPATILTKRQPATILSSPKPTYFPNYISQCTDPRGLKLASAQYATYIATAESKSPTLRGFKRYPTRPKPMTHVQPLTIDQTLNPKVQVVLHTLPPDTSFKGRIVYHNLKRVELGALLWALTWGGNQTLRHGLGMGKPFGFGQVYYELDSKASRLIPNNPKQPEATLDDTHVDELLTVFQNYMEEAAGPTGWAGSPQILNLLAMADPDASRHLPHGMELRHMLLLRCRRNGQRETLNEFIWAKQKPPGPFVLADYANVTGWRGRFEKQLHIIQAEAQRLAEQQAATKLADALKDLPEDAAALHRLARTHNWADPFRFFTGISEFLANHAALTPQAWEFLADELEHRWKGILDNPDATQGRMNKPKFKDHPRRLAKRLLGLKPDVDTR